MSTIANHTPTKKRNAYALAKETTALPEQAEEVGNHATT
jgi:hypothetical protein